MKIIAPKLLLCVGLLIGTFWSVPAPAEGHQGHHQSGITGSVNGGIIHAGPEGVTFIPNRVTVFSDTGDVVADVETEFGAQGPWSFGIFLKPGCYTVRASMPFSNYITYPVGVTVEKKQFVTIGLNFPPT